MEGLFGINGAVLQSISIFAVLIAVGVAILFDRRRARHRGGNGGSSDSGGYGDSGGRHRDSDSDGNDSGGSDGGGGDGGGGD